MHYSGVGICSKNQNPRWTQTRVSPSTFRAPDFGCECHVPSQTINTEPVPHPGPATPALPRCVLRSHTGQLRVLRADPTRSRLRRHSYSIPCVDLISLLIFPYLQNAHLVHLVISSLDKIPTDAHHSGREYKELLVLNVKV